MIVETAAALLRAGLIGRARAFKLCVGRRISRLEAESVPEQPGQVSAIRGYSAFIFYFVKPNRRLHVPPSIFLMEC